jgi:hypothetical protein
MGEAGYRKDVRFLLWAKLGTNALSSQCSAPNSKGVAHCVYGVNATMPGPRNAGTAVVRTSPPLVLLQPSTLGYVDTLCKTFPGRYGCSNRPRCSFARWTR